MPPSPEPLEAFYRTLEVHAERAAAGALGKDAQLDLGEPSEPAGQQALEGRHDEPVETYDSDEDQHDREADAEVREATRLLESPQARARELLAEMLSAAKQWRREPDAKVRALIEWIREHQCPAVAAGGAQGTGQALKWSDTRVLIFTEYADTKRYLERALDAAIEGTHLAEERIMGFHGAMSDEQREQVQRHFNGDPAEYPVRLLIATDAAREGLNLQNHCADLFHFDIPWNPARMEQRNGRIDRTLQPSPEVRCHYFVYSERQEDVVLKKLVEKVETIEEELGSLGDVVLERLEGALAGGIDPKAAEALERVEPSAQAKSAVQAELEAQRSDASALQRDTDLVAKILNRSRKVIDFDPDRLRDAVDVGLELAGAGALQPIEDAAIQGQQVFQLPELGESWTETLDSLRPPRERDEAPWDWRKRRAPAGGVSPARAHR